MVSQGMEHSGVKPRADGLGFIEVAYDRVAASFIAHIYRSSSTCLNSILVSGCLTDLLQLVLSQEILVNNSVNRRCTLSESIRPPVEEYPKLSKEHCLN
jgi:hypothetical protein